MGDNDKRSPVGEGEIAKNGYIMAHYAQYATFGIPMLTDHLIFLRH